MDEFKGSLDDLGKWQISHLKGSLVGTEFILLNTKSNGCARGQCHKNGPYDDLKLAWNPLETWESWEK